MPCTRQKKVGTVCTQNIGRAEPGPVVPGVLAVEVELLALVVPVVLPVGPVRSEVIDDFGEVAVPPVPAIVPRAQPASSTNTQATSAAATREAGGGFM